MQSRFRVFLMICKSGVGYLPFNFCCLKLRMCLTFPTLPLRRSIELRPCDRCFGPEWIAGMDSFPIHRLTLFKYSQAVLGPMHRFAHFFLRDYLHGSKNDNLKNYLLLCLRSRAVVLTRFWFNLPLKRYFLVCNLNQQTFVQHVTATV